MFRLDWLPEIGSRYAKRKLNVKISKKDYLTLDF